VPLPVSGPGLPGPASRPLRLCTPQRRPPGKKPDARSGCHCQAHPPNQADCRGLSSLAVSPSGTQLDAAWQSRGIRLGVRVIAFKIFKVEIDSEGTGTFQSP
jgi:hypothetical protein